MTASAGRTATFLLRQPRQTQGFREVLAPEASAPRAAPALTLLWIPPGRFWMGSPESEPQRQDSEGPQHLVQLQGFFIGQTPITQSQWRAVAQWKERPGERWGRKLDPKPSFFQPRSNRNATSFGQGRFSLLQAETDGDQRPVENVSWHDAIEFCNRLSQRSGRHYTLPSEAQWEYACRAGTTTAFHFGEMITPELANYDGNYVYADGSKRLYRKQTTPVGMFPANAWGLQDMHGTVWEWCLDHWHGSYEGAPTDGSAWLEAADQPEPAINKVGMDETENSRFRLLRGGAWDGNPRYCRSAYRIRHQPVFAYFSVGFRVVCLPQGPSLNS